MTHELDESRRYRGYYLKVERTAEQRRKDLTVAFDEIVELRKKLRRANIVNTTLTAIITALAFKGLELLFKALP